MRWLQKFLPGKGEKPQPDGDAAAAICSVCGLSQVRVKSLIACPGGQYLCIGCVDKLAGTFGAGASSGFSSAIEGPCSFCGRKGHARPPAMRTRTGLLCKECVRLVSQLSYERKAFPAEEFARRRKLWKQGICYFCGEDKASIRGEGQALLCYTCYDAMARVGKNKPIKEDVRCDICMKKMAGEEGQQGVKGGYICKACLEKHDTVPPPKVR
ncbi:MAG: hypothetical protein KIS92_22870 [Planctomycetota bacterium]|nr:hypothetical protein [Planctomycetota bacterium]